jgi:uncharacterized membrane protein YfcA
MESLFSQLQILDFTTTQVVLTLVIFIWSGFVRSGLGFGGAALALPLMLLVFDQPLYWLPIIGIHLLIFSALTLRKRLHNVDWKVLKETSVYIFPAKFAGVFGLLSLPNRWLVVIIYGITLLYAILWMLDLRIHSNKGWTDKLLLAIGGYFSGTSLTGAPVMAAVFTHLICKEQLRDTMFMLWFILVSIKLITLAAFAVDLQVLTALLLIPVAGIGHFLGLKAHDYMLQNDKLFKRVLGSVLIIICATGLGSLL